jgi:hypothetical protein
MQSLLHNPGYALRHSSELYAAATFAQSAAVDLASRPRPTANLRVS